MTEREFWIEVRAALLAICAAIEKKYINIPVAKTPEIEYNRSYD